jgi:Ras-related protein Rab-7A
MPYFETSAKENISVDDAFIEMAKRAIKRESENPIFMPESISGASGAIRLNPSED